MMRRAAMALLFPGVPEVAMNLIDRPDQVPWRVREPTTAMVPAAIGNAVFDAIDVRLRFALFKPAKVLAAIEKS
jgi:nicotinate dehydrogenase subunit B